MREIVTEPLTAAAFAPFGTLVAVGALAGCAINAGTAQRVDQPGLDVSAQGGVACLTIFRTLSAGSRSLRVFERHRLGSQTFVPMGQGRCLVVVTTGDAAPDESAIRAFQVEPGQGVTLQRGTWHHPLITLDAADVLVIERQAAQVDCEIVPVAGQFIVLNHFPEQSP